ncbi:MAG: hypothetical protein HC883_02560 [Bdellovibrionaceae bacterium]|nr:hypothetical protein [Pseudobdellovibrionaceae bacterium]
MSPKLDTRILLLADKDAIMQFENQLLAETVSDAMEREMKSWDARWRAEALEHYLPQGWSFACFRENRIVGYFLGQPYLFHRGLTQTLWIEHLSARQPEVARELIEVAHKWARDKHLQTVLLENNPRSEFILEDFPKATLIGSGLIELKSARF